MHIKSRRLLTLKMYLKTIDKHQIQTLFKNVSENNR